MDCFFWTDSSKEDRSDIEPEYGFPSDSVSVAQGMKGVSNIGTALVPEKGNFALVLQGCSLFD